MATTYTKADKDSAKFIDGVMAYYHQRLAQPGVTLDILFASNPDDFAITKNGHRVIGQVKKNYLADRAAGSADARLTLDAEWWVSADKKDRTALVDHELTHIDFVTDKNGNLKRDDLDRPMLKMRNHDFEVGGFFEVIERHGARAVEGQSIARIKSRMEQMQFDWEAAEVMAAQGSEVAEGEMAAV